MFRFGLPCAANRRDRETDNVATPEVSEPTRDETPELEGTDERAPAERIAAESAPAEELVTPAPIEVGAVLDVEVLWSNRAPATGVAVHLRRITPGMAYQSIDRVVSNSNGLTHFDGLPAGTYQVNADRRDEDNSQNVELVVDDEKRLEFVLVAGVEVEGVVLDRSGSPVSDAGIWLTTGHGDWLGGSVIERSGADGSFHLRSVPKQQSVGAIAAGYSPSLLVDLEDLDTSAPVRIELRMELVGGALRGIVTGPEGEPLAGALVSAGAVAGSDWGFGGGDTITERWAPRTVETNEKGEYAMRGLPIGDHPLRVRADGLPVGKTDVEIIADQTTVADVALVAGASVGGTVTGADGLPMVNAVVRAFDEDIDRSFLQGGQFDYEDTFGYPATRTDEDGHYLLTELPPGDIYLFATPEIDWRERRRGVPRAETVLNAKPGDALTWDANITEGHVIEGIVTYRDGVPMPRVFLSARNDRTGVAESVVNDEEGRFRFVNMAMEPHVLGVQLWTKPEGAGPVEAEDVYPDGGTVHLVADFDAPVVVELATVRGTIKDTGQRAASPSLISIGLESDKNFTRVYVEMDGLNFVFPDVDPGRYRAVVKVGDITACIGEWVELEPGEDRDLGTLETAKGGSLRILVPRTPETEDVEIRMFVRPPGVMGVFQVKLGRDDERLIENVSAGELEVSAYGTGISAVLETAIVKAGEETELLITLQAAAEVPFEVLWPENHALGGLTLRVENEQGESVWDIHQPNVAFLERPYKWRARLPVGRYTAIGESDSGLWSSAPFDVASLDPEQATVHLELK